MCGNPNVRYDGICKWDLWEVLTSLRNGSAAAAKLLQSCLTLCYPIDGSLPGSPVPGILQARILEWVAISFSNAEMGLVPYKRSFIEIPAPATT